MTRMLRSGGSARLDHLASGLFDRSGGFVARNQLGYREDVVGIALGRMHFADEDIWHQFVVALAITHFAGLQRHVRRQFEILQGGRQLRTVQRLRLLGGKPHRCTDT